MDRLRRGIVLIGKLEVFDVPNLFLAEFKEAGLMRLHQLATLNEGPQFGCPVLLIQGHNLETKGLTLPVKNGLVRREDGVGSMAQCGFC